MKVGDKVRTWSSHKIGTIQKVYPDGTVDVKYKGSKVIDQLPMSMCEKV